MSRDLFFSLLLPASTPDMYSRRAAVDVVPLPPPLPSSSHASAPMIEFEFKTFQQLLPTERDDVNGSDMSFFFFSWCRCCFFVCFLFFRCAFCFSLRRCRLYSEMLSSHRFNISLHKCIIITRAAVLKQLFKEQAAKSTRSLLLIHLMRVTRNKTKPSVNKSSW